MPLQRAVVAPLADGPSHGYRRRAAFEEAVGPQRGGPNIGHRYRAVNRLPRDSYVSSPRAARTAKPDRRVYELTDGAEERADTLVPALARPGRAEAGNDSVTGPGDGTADRARRAH